MRTCRARFTVAGITLLGILAFAAPSFGAGGSYVFEGGTAYQRSQVISALNASAFDWNQIPARVTIHIGPVAYSQAAPGEIWLEGSLLDAGRFAWATVQHEYAHQLDYLRFTPDIRAQLLQLLGGKNWCDETLGLRHSDYGCERFASTLAWAYWPSKDNALKPTSRKDESAAMNPASFRALITTLLAATRVTQG